MAETLPLPPFPDGWRGKAENETLLKFDRRVRFGFLLTLVLAISLGVIAFFLLRSLGQSEDEVIFDQAGDVILIEELRSILERKVSWSRTYLFTDDPTSLRQMQLDRDVLGSHFLKVEKELHSEEGKLLLDEVRSLEAAHHEAINQGIRLKARGFSGEDMEQHWRTKALPLKMRMDESISELIAFEKSQLNRGIRKLEDFRAGANHMVILSVCASLMLGAVLVWLVNGTMRKIRTYHRLRLEKEKQLESVIESRDEFITMASHELKTPLTSLKLQAQLAHRRMENGSQALMQEQVRKLVEETDRHVNRLTRLVNDMLDIVLMKTGKLRINPRPMELCKFAYRLVGDVFAELDSSGTIPSTECGGSIHGEWDPQRLEQLLRILLTNAMKYGNKRPIRIVISEEKGMVHLAVTDQGIGIEKEDQDRIFSRFERAISRNEVSGLGLGLFIARQISEAHGGKIWVESRGKNQGSAFHVTLPLEPVREYQGS